ncbi:MAG: exodeoxyribonuclease V subunit alpha [Bradymonadaceae bacterium]|nr:exodeoxyribonuclease V subunit alpha [Lujinxingiaceae bacterium]
MNSRPSLDPTGTATRAFRPLRALADDDVARLLAAAEDHELDARIAYMARELVGLQDDLAPLEARAMLCLVLVSLFNQRQGSTRLPLDASAGGYLATRLAEFVPRELWEHDASWQPANLVAQIRTLIDTGRASVIVGRTGEFKPLIVAGDYLYHQRMHHFETRLVEALKGRIARPPAALDAAHLSVALEEVLANAPLRDDGRAMTLNAEQQYGVLTALFAPLSIITGGPGTGKTSIVVSILRMLARQGVAGEAIALAAPTGKAANRMGESISAQLATLVEPGAADLVLLESLPKARTLHRLLGYSPSRQTFHFHENNRLAERFVIVDEASMIDLFMMERLIGAAGAPCNLVLLGDSEQLPSVDTGAILRDLLPKQLSTKTAWRPLVKAALIDTVSSEPLADAAVRLRESYRMDPNRPTGRKILAFAQHINDGARSEKLLELCDDLDGAPLVIERPAASALEYRAVELLRAPREFADSYSALLSDFVDHWFEQRIRALADFDARIQASYFYDGTSFDQAAMGGLEALFNHFNQARVLTLTRVHPTGSERINAAFHARYLEQREGARWDYVAGEPVLMLRNDYERGLFNGDQGLILWVQREPGEKAELMAVFARNRRFEPYHLGALRPHIEHAFAMTVHKAQGSEFKHIALVLPHRDLPLLSREILYTGVTRASESVSVIGRADLLESGSRRSIERFCGVAEKLAAGLSAGAPAELAVVAQAPSRPVQGVLFPLE